MSNATPLLEPESRSKLREKETWKPALPEAQEPKRTGATVPYLLAPHPWPRGQFRVDPEAYGRMA